MQMLPLIVMGATAILMQVAMLRQLLTVFSGNELVIGIILSVWLTAVGAGSFLGHKFIKGLKIETTSIHKIPPTLPLPKGGISDPSLAKRGEGRFVQCKSYAFPLSFFLAAILSQAMILSALLVRPVLSLEFGETVSLPATIVSVMALLLPLCLLLGAQFPLAVSYTRNNTPLVYGVEALGSLAGGMIFTFLIAGRMDVLTLTLSVGTMNMLIAILLAKNWRFLFLLLIPFLLYFGSLKTMPQFAWKGGEVVERAESRYGEILTVKTGQQMNVFASGKFQFAYPDPQTEEIKIHTAFTLHANPKTLLLIGGSPALIREALKYPVEKIDFVEMDPKMVDISLSILSSYDRERIRDKRVTLLQTDARRFIRQTAGQTYDLILLNLSEPSTAQVNRFYTIEFFREAGLLLNQGGLVLLSLPASSGYIGRRMQMLQSTVYNSLKQVFPYVQVSSEEYGIICGSDSVIQSDPLTLEERYNKRAVRTDFFVPSLFSDIFSLMKMDGIRALLGSNKEMNTDMKPAAYRYSLMLWLESQGSQTAISLFQHGRDMAYALMVLIISCGIALFRKKQVVSFSVFISGYAAMACTITLMLAYQALFGYIYEMIGLLTAVFMAGLAAGSYVMRKTARPLHWMRAAGVIAIVLLLSTPLLLQNEALFFMLNFLAGVVAGAEFIAANQIIKEQTAEQTAGRLYGIDLIGSFFGALLTSLVFVPLMGIPISLLLVALLKMVAVIMLFFFSYEKA